jgi:hypothetical protein
MGSFYANISIRTAAVETVAGALKKLKRRGYLARQGDWCIFYDSAIDTAEPEEIGHLALQLSAECSAPTFAVSNYDDDVLWYGLYDGARTISEYNSAPGYFDGSASGPEGGDSFAISQSLRIPETQSVVENILRNREYVFAGERHRDLAVALKLPSASVGFGFTYLDRGELPNDFQGSDLLRIA